MLANRFGIERGYSRGRPAAPRGACQQRERRPPIRPPGAGCHQAAQPPGAAAPPGVPRSADRPAEPVRCSWSASARSSSGATASSRCCSSTWTTSRSSTTRSATRSATRCSSRLRAPAALGPAAGRRRPPGRRRVRGHAPGGRRLAGSDAHRGDADPGGVRPSGPCRVEAHLGARQRRHRGQRTGAGADQLIRDADLAMYQAKAKGKSRFEVFEPSLADGDDAPARRQGGARQGDRARGDRRGVPADRLARDRSDQCRRGAGAVGAPRPRPGAARPSSSRSPRRPA